MKVVKRIANALVFLQQLIFCVILVALSIFCGVTQREALSLKTT